MKDKAESGLKSAFDLAMERLEKKNGPVAALNAQQKAALAEADSKTQAFVAETEIVLNQQIAAARAAGDLEKAGQLELQRANEIRKIRERGEAEKEDIRKGG